MITLNRHRKIAVTIIYLLFLLSRINLLYAQEEVKGEMPAQAISFFYAAKDDAESFTFLMEVGGKPVDVRLVPNLIPNEPIVRPAAQGLKLFTKADDPAQRQLVAEVSFPASWTHVLIIIPQFQPGDVKLFPFNMSKTVIPEGTVGFYNFTSKEVAFQINSEKGILDPKKLSSYKVQTRPDRNTGMAQLRLAQPDGDSWNIIFRRSLVLSKAERSMFLIIPYGDGAEILRFPIMDNIHVITSQE